jgi:hypothetical protein
MYTTRVSQFFYMGEDDMVEILVEERLFRIPTFFLARQSSYFNKLFNERDDIYEGSPLVLDEGVTAAEFESLLHALDPHPSSGTKPSTSDEWKDVLKLASKWHFPQTRATAIKKLEALNLDPLERVRLAATYEIPHWFVDAYIGLCQRPEALSPDEVRILLPEDVSTFTLVQKAGVRYSATSRPAPSAGEQSKFGQQFPGVSKGDHLIETYSCALERRGTFTHGRLYVTREHVCFHSPLLEASEQITLPVSTIGEPRKEWTAKIFPNAIRVSTPDVSHKFTSFASFGWRDTAFDVIYSLWVERKRVEMFSCCNLGNPAHPVPASLFFFLFSFVAQIIVFLIFYMYLVYTRRG